MDRTRRLVEYENCFPIKRPINANIIHSKVEKQILLLTSTACRVIIIIILLIINI